MNREWVRRYCMSLPHTTEQFLWKIDLVFKIGGKMYATLVLEPHAVCLAFKCTPEDFDELIERPGIIPAPYVGAPEMGSARILRRHASAKNWNRVSNKPMN